MVDIDHSVVYRREDGSRGSGTVVHFSSNYLVLEIYDKSNVVRFNELLGRIRVTLGQVLVYDGKGVVCEISDSSSIQLVTILLRDSCIAIGNSDSEVENRFVFERFLNVYMRDLQLPESIERSLFDFTHFFSQLLSGIKVSKHFANRFNRLSTEGQSPGQSSNRNKMVEIGLERLNAKYASWCEEVVQCGDEEKEWIGAFFKRHIFPMSVSSRIFRSFHSEQRFPYFNYRVLKLLKADSVSLSQSIRGYFLDEFFRANAQFEFIESRSNHWAGEIEEWLIRSDKSMRVLLLGTDFTIVQVIHRLNKTDPSRVFFDVYCTPDEKPDDFLNEIRTRLPKDFDMSHIRMLQAPVQRLLQLYFRQQKDDFSQYDRVFSTSFLESLSRKTAVYVIDFIIRLLAPSGSFHFFTNNPQYSPVREHWLLWFEQTLDLEQWKSYLPNEAKWADFFFDYGKLSVVESNPKSLTSKL